MISSVITQTNIKKTNPPVPTHFAIAVYDQWCLDIVPLNVEDTSVKITDLGEGSGVEVQRAPCAHVTGVLVNDTGDDSFLVDLVGDAGPSGRRRGCTRIAAHLVSVQGDDGLDVAIPVDVAEAIKS